MNTRRLEKKLGYSFKKREILVNALTHSSYLPELKGGKSYETMEFFGDSILDFAVSELIYRKNPALTEGEMTRIRSMVVSAKSLCSEARELGLGEFIFFGKGEKLTGGHEKESILSAVFESLIAAIYLDAGIMKVRRFVKGRFEKIIEEIIKSGSTDHFVRDSKSILQEALHKQGRPLPEYVVMKEEGPPHNRRFSVELRIAGKTISYGTGRSKKEAEKEAAAKALMSHLRFEDDEEGKEG